MTRRPSSVLPAHPHSPDQGENGRTQRGRGRRDRGRLVRLSSWGPRLSPAARARRAAALPDAAVRGPAACRPRSCARTTSCTWRSTRYAGEVRRRGGWSVRSAGAASACDARDVARWPPGCSPRTPRRAHVHTSGRPRRRTRGSPTAERSSAGPSGTTTCPAAVRAVMAAAAGGLGDRARGGHLRVLYRAGGGDWSPAIVQRITGRPARPIEDTLRALRRLPPAAA